ncbi:MAG: hypothetical protein GY947_16085 [Rhodobacteraceae bacterium]|nr:hypothetical protein [Paracoccaceae bacterium]
MNTFTRMAIASAALVAIVGSAAAPSFAKGRQHWNFDVMDSNADGFLTVEEVAAVRDQKFEELDTDKNGTLSKDEIAAHREMRHAKWEENRAERAKEAFTRIDSNKDGSISPEELETAMAERDEHRRQRRAKHRDHAHGGFMRHVDSNDDGEVTKAELTTNYTTRMFERLDTDKDNRISKAEAESARKGFRRHWNLD